MYLTKVLSLLLCFNTCYSLVYDGATVHPADPFDPVADAARLHKALQGLGTDEIDIIHVLAQRTLSQRLLIETTFKSNFAKDLLPLLTWKLTGNFRVTILELMSPLVQLYAKELNKAIDRPGTDEEALIEILTTLPNKEIRNVAQVYKEMFEIELETDVADDTSGSLQKLLVSLCRANRSESTTVDFDKSAQDASELFNAAGGFKTEVFHDILVSRSYPQLRQTFNDFYNFAGKDIELVIKNTFSGDIRDGFFAIVRHVKNPITYFAQRLYDALDRLGAKDNTLIRIIVSRSEIDLEDIKIAYARKYIKSLGEVVEKHTIGSYRKALLTLIA